MSLFEFLMVLVSLIIGLGIAELLSGVAQAIRNRNTISFYWVHIIFIMVVFVALLQQWWEIWGLNHVDTWTFAGLVMMLGGPIGLFLIAHLLLPKELANVDLKDYYYSDMSPVFWIGVITVVVASSFRPLIFDHDLVSVDNISSLLLVLIFITLASSKNTIIHSVAVVLIFLLILFDTIFFRMNIQ